MAASKRFSLKDVSTHNHHKNCWITINGKVYDVTAFKDEHPGGEDALLTVAGTDASKDFENVGHSDDAKNLMKNYEVGVLEGWEQPQFEEYLNRSSTDQLQEPEIKESLKESAVSPKSTTRFSIWILLPLVVLGLGVLISYFFITPADPGLKKP